MSKKLWDWCYLNQPVDYIDLFRSENIENGKKMHDAISKRMKELIGSGPPLKFVGPTEPICFMHYTDEDNVFDMVPEYIKQCDCEMKILKNRTPTKPVAEWHIDSEAKFDENIIKDLHIVGSNAKTVKLQMNGRQLRTEKFSKNEQLNEKYDFVNFSWVNNPIDLNAKLKRNAFQLKNPKEEQHPNPSIKQENESSQVSICSFCNYYNEWIPFDPNYKCYKCKKGL